MRAPPSLPGCDLLIPATKTRALVHQVSNLAQCYSLPSYHVGAAAPVLWCRQKRNLLGFRDLSNQIKTLAQTACRARDTSLSRPQEQCLRVVMGKELKLQLGPRSPVASFPGHPHFVRELSWYPVTLSFRGLG